MIRKVIKQGHNTLTVTLPSQWALQQGIKPGDEIKMLEQEKELLLSKEVSPSHSCIEIDLSLLDMCSILHSIRNAYRLGYDEIILHIGEKTTPYYRINDKVPVIDVIKYELNNLIGLEIVRHGENTVVLKDISNPRIEDFENILRRVFLVLNECSADLIEGMQKKDMDTIKGLIEKHDIVTKFASYCLRMLTKFSPLTQEKNKILYHIIASLDKIADVYKNVSRDIPSMKLKVSATTFSLIKDIHKSQELYMQLFYKRENEKVIEINKTRDLYIRSLKENILQFSKEEIVLLKDLQMILEILADLVVARLGLEVKLFHTPEASH